MYFWHAGMTSLGLCFIRHVCLECLALEFLDWQSVDLVTRHTELSNPLGISPFYMLIETAGSNGVHDEEVRCRSVLLYHYEFCYRS